MNEKYIEKYQFNNSTSKINARKKKLIQEKEMEKDAAKYLLPHRH